jgi:hypothetical protein
LAIVPIPEIQIQGDSIDLLYSGETGVGQLYTYRSRLDSVYISWTSRRKSYKLELVVTSVSRGRVGRGGWLVVLEALF